jgi:mannose-1-phosphate guanylyltransferase/mannose-6-phosphate isomerase
MGVHPIVLCGGRGSRLWPASTARNPKPFVDLLGGPSLYQRTLARLAALPGAHAPTIVTGADHAPQARDQLAALSGTGTFLVEPVGRDSGPALLAAALWIAREHPRAVALAVASDHHIPDEAAFAAAVDAALPAAEAGHIVTFGVRPTYPAIAYGYIRPAGALEAVFAVQAVGRFVEKPDLERARALVAEGCLWNSGNFMFRVDVFLEEAARHTPEALDAVRRAIEAGAAEAGLLLLGAPFAQAPKISVDVGIMEKTARAAVLPIDYAWSDLGAWDSIWAASARDGDGNAVHGAAVVRDSTDCLVRADEGSRLVVIGARGLAVVARRGEVLVAALDRAADLKAALAALDQAAPPAATASGPARPALDEPPESAGPRLRAWLFEQALPLWWCFGADHADGGFHERLGQTLVPIRLDRRALVQARQVHVFATAALMGWTGPWAAAVDHGLGYLDSRHRRPDGLYRQSLDAEGAAAQDLARLYDQAFVLLALATSARAMPSRLPALEGQARALGVAVRRTFARGGGFRAEEASETWLADPIMHLFEAVLAWSEIAHGDDWRGWAGEIAEHFLTRMLDAEGGRIVEEFDARWRPFDGPEGRRLEPGHHFEWAWLMERWSRLTRQTRPHAAAMALYASGERGVDPASGLVLDALRDDFSVLEPTSRLWPQTERVKAALLLAPKGDAAAAGARAIEAYLDTPHAGLWRDTPRGPGAREDDPAMASSFYHIIGAIQALQLPHGAQAFGPRPLLRQTGPVARVPHDAP